MKFSTKVFFCTIIVIALAMGFGGYFLIKSNFDAAIEREISLIRADGEEGKYASDGSIVVCKIIRNGQTGRGISNERRFAYAAFPFKSAGRRARAPTSWGC